MNKSDGPVQLVSKPGSRSTGIGRYAWEIERGLRGAGVEVRAARLTTPVPEIAQRAIRRIGYDVAAFTRSYPIRADVAPGWITHLTSQTLATLLLTQRLPRPVVVTVHDILPYVLRNDPDLSTYRHRLDRTMDSLAMRALKRADLLIADSRFTQSTLTDHLGIDPNAIEVVHLGVDHNKFRPLAFDADFIRRYDLNADAKYVLFVGSEDPRKDLSTLLRAIALVRGTFPDIKLIKIGAPAFNEMRRSHLELCSHLNIQNAVQWIDEVPEADLPAFYNLALVFAFPSRFEGFGFPVLEALSCGTPVVAANASSVPELVGEVAALVPERDPEALAEAITNYLAAPPNPDDLVGHAIRFNWERTVCETRTAYERAMSNRPMRQTMGAE
jgi:glycosyltransferase involved in cell wall biosynthesis